MACTNVRAPSWLSSWSSPVIHSVYWPLRYVTYRLDASRLSQNGRKLVIVAAAVCTGLLRIGSASIQTHARYQDVHLATLVLSGLGCGSRDHLGRLARSNAGPRVVACWQRSFPGRRSLGLTVPSPPTRVGIHTVPVDVAAAAQMSTNRLTGRMGTCLFKYTKVQ
jgi:hypothetical protein